MRIYCILAIMNVCPTCIMIIKGYLLVHFPPFIHKPSDCIQMEGIYVQINYQL